MNLLRRAALWLAAIYCVLGSVVCTHVTARCAMTPTISNDFLDAGAQ